MLFVQMLCSSICFAQEAAGVAALLLQSQVLLHQESPLVSILHREAPLVMHCSALRGTSCSTLRRTSSDALRRISRGISDNVLPWEAAREAPWVMGSRPQQWLLCTHYQPLKIAVCCEGKISIKVRSRPNILVKCTWQTTHSGGWQEKWGKACQGSFPFSCHYNHYHCFDYFTLAI